MEFHSNELNPILKEGTLLHIGSFTQKNSMQNASLELKA